MIRLINSRRRSRNRRRRRRRFCTGKTFSYDANGNLTSDGTRTFEWDARNQLVAVTVGTHRSEFFYDGRNRRGRIVEKENGVTQSDLMVVWFENQVSEERAADGTTVTRRALSSGEQLAGASQFFTTDHLGSTGDITDNAVGLLARYSYDPWGRRSVTAGTDVTKVGFTGHEWDPAGATWRAQYRGYAPDLGRWLSVDPLGAIDGPNAYPYVRNGPLGSVDPLGLYSRLACILNWTLAGAGAGARVGAASGAAGGVVFAGVGSIPGSAGGAAAGAAAGAGAGMITGILVCPPDGVCLVEDSRPRFEPDERCKQVKQDCIERCSDTALPTGDHGFRFWNCVNKCMAESNCY